MRVYDNSGFREALELDALADILSKRDDRDVNTFWMSRSEEENYPVLVMMVAGPNASLHFLPAEGHPGFRSLAREGMPQGGTVAFYTNNSQEKTFVSGDSVIPVEAAKNAAREFFLNNERPASVLWEEL